VAFSPDGKRMAVGGGTWDDAKQAYVSGELTVWDAQTGKQLLSCKDNTGPVRSVAFSPDGKCLAGATGDKVVKVWDAQTGQELTTCKGHTAPVVSVAFSPDGARLGSSSGRPNSISTFGDPGEPGEVLVWDARTGQKLLSLKGHSRYVNSVAFSPDGKRLATLSRDHSVKVWDAQTGQAVLTLKPVGTKIGGSLVFSPDGKRLASTNVPSNSVGPRSSDEIKVWDAQTGQELSSLKGHQWGVLSVAFSPDGRRLASASGDGMVKVWDVQTSQELLSLQGGTSAVFSPSGHCLATNGRDGMVTIWDATPLPEKP
jgi:WD40 repeat protein